MSDLGGQNRKIDLIFLYIQFPHPNSLKLTISPSKRPILTFLSIQYLQIGRFFMIYGNEHQEIIAISSALKQNLSIEQS